MINIKEAIEKSKNLKNISNGGSECFDFGDIVLVKYSLPVKYVRNGNRSRSCEEMVMEGINYKVENGVNTPRHLAIERVIEENNDICYVLQEKCKGRNCATYSTYGAPIEQVCKELEFVYNIPFSQYKKLISDGCELYEMGYEAKNKNLFYDVNTGFWFIDFLSYEKDNSFAENDPVKIFKALKYVIPKPRQIASFIGYGTKLTTIDQEKIDFLENSIEAKRILSIKAVLSNFEKYEKFYLINNTQKSKKFLMDNQIVNKDLFKLEEKDYKVFDELYEIVINNIIDKICNKGVKFWNIEVNDIRIDSELFGLIEIWKLHKDNNIDKNDYVDLWDYDNDIKESYTQRVLNDISYRLKQLEPDDNINSFLDDMKEKFKEDVNKNK